MDDRDLLLRLRLARARGVGPRAVLLLRELLGSLDPLLEASPGDLEARGVPPRILHALADPALARRGQAELARVRALGATLLGAGLPGYPEALLALHDPPVTLSVRGAITPDDARAVAIVGARRATPAGVEVARALAADLAHAGVTVVSGLARGVDRAAHEGALAAGGRTIAVLGSGVANPYPAQHAGLAERIAQAGAVVSELEPDAAPSRHTFPQRNRIVAALSLGVVVVEAGPRSGALITADLGMQLGRELFAVPGSVLEPLSRGPNRLLREGAHLVESAADVLDVLFGVGLRDDGLGALLCERTEDDAPPAPAGLDAVSARVLGALTVREPRPLERVAAATTLGVDDVMTALGRLELAGRVRASVAGYVKVGA
ncbi:MAG: DNA-processing protein DprA [Planctomycetes bacterium]|nr:DNA-processing protein DprA [Planctomycetota bacterium]